MNLRAVPVQLWVGLVLIFGAGIGHLWLEIDRGARLAPQLLAGPQIVAHTFEVITAAQDLGQAVQDAERGQRGYLLTDDAQYLAPYRQALDDIPKLLARLKQLTADNAEQQRRWPNLEHQVGVKLAELKQTLDARERDGPEAAQRIIQSNIGLDVMAGVNGSIDAAVAAERELLRERLAIAASNEIEGRRAALLGVVLEIVALTLGVLLLLTASRSIQAARAGQQHAQERFRLFADGITDYAIFMLDPAGHIIDWNPGAERIKGYLAHEVIGQHFSLFYTPEDRAAGAPAAALERAAKEGRFEHEGYRMRKDGKRFLASVLLAALRDDKGHLVAYGKITRDIEARVQQQQALAQYQKMDAIGQLTGGVAHDFNNFLHVIRNATDILERRIGTAKPEVREPLEMIRRNADRAASLTARLLAFSRRQVLDPKPVDPHALVVEVTTLLKQVLAEGVEVETVIGAGTWHIFVDINQLETAILNLALNARDAMAGVGKLTIEISNAYLDEAYADAHAEVKAGQYVMIAVSDTGPGMAPDVVARAFEPFFTTKETGRGTGLGLSQVYGFTKQSGGHAKIYSEPGHGTTVKLYLPRFVGAGVAERPRTLPLVAHAGQGTILVVEDADDVRAFTSTVLQESGYVTLIAGDAAAALAILDATPAIDLLFTDIGLPGGMNGRQLADEVVRRRPGLKVLFTTGYTRNAVIHHGRLDPGVEILVKPFTQASLVAKVREMLGR